MKHLPLFAGINGFGLAADWMGWEQTAHCEIDEFCQTIIQYYWPQSIPHYDIKKTDFKQYKGTVDIISGGFPCQPYSVAGKRKGKEDERHLWPEMLRAIREIQPRWVIGENVRGLINWSGGLVFEEVQTDLESEGYEVWAFILPACGVNAPHRRDRVWFVAHADFSNDGRTARKDERKSRKERIQERDEIWESLESSKVRPSTDTDIHGHQSRRFKKNRREARKSQSQSQKRKRFRNDGRRISEQGFATYTNRRRFTAKKYRETKSGQHCEKGLSIGFENFPTQSPICSRNDGISSRLDGITFPKWRNESIKAAGNAIVPQVAFEIFKVIQEINSTLL